jgi:hypothetical protein
MSHYPYLVYEKTSPTESKLVGGVVKTFVLGEDIFVDQDHQRLPVFFDLVGVFDLNGDGKLEVVVFQANASGYKIVAYEWTRQQFLPRLSTGCGKISSR